MCQLTCSFFAANEPISMKFGFWGLQQQLSVEHRYRTLRRTVTPLHKHRDEHCVKNTSRCGEYLTSAGTRHLCATCVVVTVSARFSLRFAQ
jgi:hypothetical protein